jgi:hypothetical protein
MPRKHKLVKEPASATQQNRKESSSIEKATSDQNLKLKKLVADFKKAHKAFCNDLLHATYRLIHDARKIGNLLLKMQEEGGFKSKRQLHVWLERQAKVSISQPTFYRYIQAAENFQKVEVIHGTKMLTEISSNKVLKMLANPRVEPLPSADEPEAGKLSGNPDAGKEAKNEPSKKNNAPQPPDEGKLRKGKAAAILAKQVVHNQHEAAEKPSDAQPGENTNFHHGCKDFKIDDDRTLSFTNQHGDRVYVESEQNGIDRLLVKAISTIAVKGGEQ